MSVSDRRPGPREVVFAALLALMAAPIVAAAPARPAAASDTPVLVAAGALPAGTVDFLGDTLGSFSSLAVDVAHWTRTADGYRGVLWTLPDRGRNDPDAGLFYDYAGRLERLQLRIEIGAGQRAGQATLTPDGGLLLRDFNGAPFTGADPGEHTVVQNGILLPSPAQGVGAGKISLDAEALQFTADGHFYIGDEYAAHVYYFAPDGRLQGVIVPPPAVQPRRDGRVMFDSRRAPDSGRRNNQGVEGMGLSPDGRRLFVALQSALVQDSATGDASGRINTRVMVYDVSRDPLPTRPIGHYVVQLPTYAQDGKGTPDRTAAQSELRALDDHRFLLLARDGNGLGSDTRDPIVYKSVLLVDTRGASNLAGSDYEQGIASVIAQRDGTALKPGIVPARSHVLLDLLDPVHLARAGLDTATAKGAHAGLLSEKWEAMDLLPTRDATRPDERLLLVGNDNDFIARHCVMQGMRCDSAYDNDNRVLVYRLTVPAQAADPH
jgi:hypothetical protein